MKSFQRYLIYNRRKNKISTALDSAHAPSRSRAFVKCPQRRQQKGLPSKGLKSLLLSPMQRLSHCFHANYSMIVATRPEPTVRTSSRYQTGVLRCANGDFSCDLCGKIRIFHCVRMVFGDFVIMVLSLFHIHFPSFSIKR